MARLTIESRRKLKKMYDADERTFVMASKLNCSMTTIYDELKRGYNGTDENDRPIYDPDLAQRKVNASVKRCAQARKKAVSSDGPKETAKAAAAGQVV